MIKVVNKKTHVPTKFDFFIGRGSPLGNPYTSIQSVETKAEFICSNKEESLKKYNDYLLNKIQEKDKKICDALNTIYSRVKKQQNIYIACYCEPLPCHGHIIRNLIVSKFYVHKTYVGEVNLQVNQIAVVGTNTQGRHGKGFAKTCNSTHGLQYGVSRGRSGNCYGIITKDLTQKKHPSRTKEQVLDEIKALYAFAKLDLINDYVVPYNCHSQNLNNYTSLEMADFFAAYDIPKNFIFEENFYKLIVQQKYGF